MSLGTVAAVVGIGASAYSIYNQSQNSGGGGGGGGGGSGTAYVPQGQGQADQQWQSLMQQLGGDIGNVSGQITPALQQAYGATQPGGQFGNLGNLAQLYQQILQQQGAGAYGAGQQLQGAGNQLWQTAQDPQNALYQRLLQQTQDQSRAATSMRGIGMGGEAAGIENQDVQNLMLNWQNQQLGRQAQGLQGMAGAYDASGRQNQLGNANLAGAYGMGTSGAALPFQLASLYGGAMNQAAYQPYGALGSMYGQYMGLGQSGASNAFNQNASNLGALTSGLTTLGGTPGGQAAGNWLSSQFSTPSPYYSGGSAGNSWTSGYDLPMGG